TVARGIVVHPMHFLFIYGGLFLFYLLASYLTSYVPVIAAVLIALAVSSGGVIYYVNEVFSDKMVVKFAALVLVLFQWIFITAFFFQEHTGFIIALAAVFSYFVLMKITAKIDWASKTW